MKARTGLFLFWWFRECYRKNQIARLIKNGHDRKQLAIIYDIGISTIYRYHPVGDIQAEETTGQTQENENR
ncbi:TPA: helix-turn-helix domain-containing protein [Escherichia coli]|nr:recombinase [Escherichia coli]HDP6806162.1 helix-turn-helix domain-containing protein [Escherichia coli]HDP9868317.1 helix-turn-helix domain-containing protein [Escherichia coli]HDQ0784107.1 helix-turn-helix domain-containing protein [Escherichia coli]